MKECKIEPQHLVDLSQAQESLSRITQKLLSDTKLDAKLALKELGQANRELTMALKIVSSQLREAARPVDVPEPSPALLTGRNLAALAYPIERLELPTSNAIRNARLVVLDYKTNQPIAYQNGIRTIGELVQFKAQELASVGKFGEKTAEVFRVALERFGLSIGMELKPSALEKLGMTKFRVASESDRKLEFKELTFGQLAVERNAEKILGEHVSAIPGLSQDYVDNLKRVYLSSAPSRGLPTKYERRFESVEKVWEFVQLGLGEDINGAGNKPEIVAQFLLDHGLCFGMRQFPAGLVTKFGIDDMHAKWDLGNWFVTGALTEKDMGWELNRNRRS